ncbi:hypothetical protein, partial [Streptomyces sp. NPDC002346]
MNVFLWGDDVPNAVRPSAGPGRYGPVRAGQGENMDMPLLTAAVVPVLKELGRGAYVVRHEALCLYPRLSR